MSVTRPVIFLPGFPGSHLRREPDGERIFLDLGLLTSPTAKPRVLLDLRGPDDFAADRSIVPGDPIRVAVRLLVWDLAKQAQSLYDILGGIGYETRQRNSLFQAVGWDWRKPVDDLLVQVDLERAILNLERESGRRATIIVHSTGGLVLRALLEAKPELADHLESVIAIGVPWAGTLRPLQFLAGLAGFGPLTAEETVSVLTFSWAAYDLLPPAEPNRELGFSVAPDGTPVDLLDRRGWFPPAYAEAMAPRADRAQARHAGRESAWDLDGRSLPVWNLVGVGVPTLSTATVGEERLDVARSTPEEIARLDDGDGTVARRSAAWIDGPDVRVTSFTLPVGFYPGLLLANQHATLWGNPGGKALLEHLLGGRDWQPFVYAALDPDTVNDFGQTLRLRATAFERDGAPMEDLAIEVDGVDAGEVDRLSPPDLAGRIMVAVPREQIRLTQDRRFRRLVARVRSDGRRVGKPHTFLIPA